MNSNHKTKLNVATQDLTHEYLVDVTMANGNLIDISKLLMNIIDLGFDVNKTQVTLHRPRVGWPLDVAVRVDGTTKSGKRILIKGEEALNLLLVSSLKNIFVFEFFTSEQISPYYEMEEELDEVGVTVDRNQISYAQLKAIHATMVKPKE